MSNSVVLMGFQLDNLNERQVTEQVLDDIVSGQGGWMINPNVDMLRQIVNDPDLKELSRQADLAIADGMPLIWASRLRELPLVERVPGRQFIWTMCRSASLRGVSVFLLGGESGVAAEAAAALIGRKPNLSIVERTALPTGSKVMIAAFRTLSPNWRELGRAWSFADLDSPSKSA